jgi:hypothetical protein
MTQMLKPCPFCDGPTHLKPLDDETGCQHLGTPHCPIGRWTMTVEQWNHRASSIPEPEAAPIPMVLFCPECGQQHIDKPEPEDGWENPPHKSHKCVGPNGCGCIWRPADVPTDGVAAIETHGTADTWFAASRQAAPANSPEAASSDEDAVELVARAIHPSRIADLELALDLALARLVHLEPGDSRAVSNEFVAMAAISCNIRDNLDECRQIIRDALGDDAAAIEGQIAVFQDAEKIAAVAAEQDAVEQYVAEYELCGDDGYYAPTDHERGLIMDAMQGWLVDRDRLVREARAASGIETEGHDADERHGAEHESPVPEEGDAHA